MKSFRRGQSLTAAQLNHIIEQLKRRGLISVSPQVSNMNIVSMSGNDIMYLSTPEDEFVAMITPTVPFANDHVLVPTKSVIVNGNPYTVRDADSRQAPRYTWREMVFGISKGFPKTAPFSLSSIDKYGFLRSIDNSYKTVDLTTADLGEFRFGVANDITKRPAYEINRNPFVPEYATVIMKRFRAASASSDETPNELYLFSYPPPQTIRGASLEFSSTEIVSLISAVAAEAFQEVVNHGNGFPEASSATSFDAVCRIRDAGFAAGLKHIGLRYDLYLSDSACGT